MEGICTASKAKNMYKLMEELDKYPNTKSAFRFGDSIHFSPKDESIEPKSVENYLLNKDQTSPEIKLIEATVEDCFMAQMTE